MILLKDLFQKFSNNQSWCRLSKAQVGINQSLYKICVIYQVLNRKVSLKNKSSMTMIQEIQFLSIRKHQIIHFMKQKTQNKCKTEKMNFSTYKTNLSKIKQCTWISSLSNWAKTNLKMRSRIINLKVWTLKNHFK